MSTTKHASTSRLLAAVREAQDHTLRLDQAAEHARARARLLQAVDAASRAAVVGSAIGSRGPGWRWGIGTLAAAACVLALVVVWPGEHDGEHALAFELDGAPVATNDLGDLIVAGQHSRMLAFSDSTSIELSPGGRMHIDDIRSTGASVVLDAGEVALAVHHERNTSWKVTAGPWQVHVTGTQFSVAWEPAAEHFRVAVTEGSVRVEGPNGDITNLRGGDTMVRQRGKATIEPETLVADRDDLDRLDDHADDAGHDAEPDGSPVIDLDPAASSDADATKLGPAPAKRVSWDQHFDNSEYDAAWRTLSQLPGGIHGEAVHANANTLLDLADVAHYTKHGDDARKLLEQLRERFPASDEAGKAAFALGRLAATTGSQAKAAMWFELYLAEVPNGSLADDALGRLIDSYDALDRNDDASTTATQYLARFPKGAHADKAAKILAR
jgi:ferric-dicitrate binding protein FerR (iron transport regulator)